MPPMWNHLAPDLVAAVERPVALWEDGANGRMRKAPHSRLSRPAALAAAGR